MWHDLQMSSRPMTAQHLRDLARLRRVRDQIDREYAQPLDVEALARGAHMSAGHFSRQFRLAYGESPYGYLMTRRIERGWRCCVMASTTSPRSVSRSAARRWGPSAVASPNWSVCRLAPTGATRRARWWGCRRAWPNRWPDRSGIEKRRSGAATRVTATPVGCRLLAPDFAPRHRLDITVQTGPRPTI
jgi:hypothetical protein